MRGGELVRVLVLLLLLLRDLHMGDVRGRVRGRGGVGWRGGTGAGWRAVGVLNDTLLLLELLLLLLLLLAHRPLAR